VKKSCIFSPTTIIVKNETHDPTQILEMIATSHTILLKRRHIVVVMHCNIVHFQFQFFNQLTNLVFLNQIRRFSNAK